MLDPFANPYTVQITDLVAQMKTLEDKLEQARSLVDRLINEPNLCDSCSRQIG